MPLEPSQKYVWSEQASIDHDEAAVINVWQTVLDADGGVQVSYLIVHQTGDLGPLDVEVRVTVDSVVFTGAGAFLDLSFYQAHMDPDYDTLQLILQGGGMAEKPLARGTNTGAAATESWINALSGKHIKIEIRTTSAVVAAHLYATVTYRKLIAA